MSENQVIKSILVEGCMAEGAKQVISQMLQRRLTEVDASGQQAKFILKLLDEVESLPLCDEMFNSSSSDENDGKTDGNPP